MLFYVIKKDVGNEFHIFFAFVLNRKNPRSWKYVLPRSWPGKETALIMPW